MGWGERVSGSRRPLGHLEPSPCQGFLCQATCFSQTPHLAPSSRLRVLPVEQGVSESSPSLVLLTSLLSAPVSPGEKARKNSEAIITCFKLEAKGWGVVGGCSTYEGHVVIEKA